MSFTRRDILISLLGLSAGGGCKKTKTPEPSFEGGFLREASPSIGHQLRDGKAFGEPARREEVPVLVLGAGVAGLSAARRLKRAKLRVKVLDLEAEEGGTSWSGRSGALRYPWGAHYLPCPLSEESQPDLVELLEEMGAASRGPGGALEYEESQLCAVPKERLYFKGFWYEGLYPRVGASPADLEQLARFQKEIDGFIGRHGPDGRRGFILPLAGCSDDPELQRYDEMSIGDWLTKQGFDSPRLKWFVDYGCRDDFGSSLETTSAWAALHYFSARTKAPGEDSAEYLTWPEGNGRLIDQLVAAVGRDALELDNLVVSVAPAPDGRRALVRSYDRKKGSVTEWLAERVVFALPSFLRRYLIRGFENVPEYHPDYSPWMVANVHLSSPPDSRGFPLCWDNVLYESRSLGYVVATHQMHGYRGPTVWTYYLPLPEADPKKERAKLLSLSYKEACDAIVYELGRTHFDFRKRLERIDIVRWGHAMVRPSVGAVWSPSRRAAARPVGPLHFAHTDLSSMALFEEAFFHGNRAAREIISEISA